MTLIIAEAGVNHNGSLDMAKLMIDAAVKAGADVVKFQTGKPENVISRNAAKAEYQLQTTGSGESQLEMVKKLELKKSDYHILVQHCKKQAIQFLSTPFDLDSVDFLSQTLGTPLLKLPSGEVTNPPLLFKSAQTGKPVILSTGMSTLGEVETALSILALGYLHPEEDPSMMKAQAAFCSEEGQHILNENVTVLHCTTEYPAPFESVNLRKMDTLRSSFGLPVGLSDHSSGIAISIAAVARGAKIIEKHFTLDRSLPGPDHKASLEPDEFRAMVEGIRAVDKALGKSVKIPATVELKNKSIVRRSQNSS